MTATLDKMAKGKPVKVSVEQEAAAKPAFGQPGPGRQSGPGGTCKLEGSVGGRGLRKTTGCVAPGVRAHRWRYGCSMVYQACDAGPPTGPGGLLLDAGGVFLLPDPVVLADVLSGWSLQMDVEAYDDRGYYEATAALDAAISVGADWRRSGYSAHFTSLGLAAEHVSDAVDGLLVREGFWTRIVPASVNGLGCLVAAGIPVAIVSNSDGTVEHQLRQAGICQVGPGESVPVRAVIDSTLVGVSKPDSRIFHLGAEAIGCHPDSCIYVGDLIFFDVAGAWGAGLWPVHFDPYNVCPHRREHDHVQQLEDLLKLDWGKTPRP